MVIIRFSELSKRTFVYRCGARVQHTTLHYKHQFQLDQNSRTQPRHRFVGMVRAAFCAACKSPQSVHLQRTSIYTFDVCCCFVRRFVGIKTNSHTNRDEDEAILCAKRILAYTQNSFSNSDSGVFVRTSSKLYKYHCSLGEQHAGIRSTSNYSVWRTHTQAHYQSFAHTGCRALTRPGLAWNGRRSFECV